VTVHESGITIIVSSVLASVALCLCGSLSAKAAADPLIPGPRLERVADVEGDRNAQAGVLGEDVAVRVVVDLHADADAAARADERAKPHEVLKREVIAGIPAVEHHLGNVRRPGQ